MYPNFGSFYASGFFIDPQFLLYLPSADCQSKIRCCCLILAVLLFISLKSTNCVRFCSYTSTIWRGRKLGVLAKLGNLGESVFLDFSTLSFPFCTIPKTENSEFKTSSRHFDQTPRFSKSEVFQLQAFHFALYSKRKIRSWKPRIFL